MNYNAYSGVKKKTTSTFINMAGSGKSTLCFGISSFEGRLDVASLRDQCV